MPSVTVSIVSHGQWALTRALLLDLQQWCRDSVGLVVVTMNIPEQADLKGVLLPVRLLTNPQPRGFGANHNAAFGLCATPWFLVLNPDIRFDTNVVAPMLATAEATTGLIAPRIREPGKPQPEPFRDVLTPMELLRRRMRDHHPPVHPAWVAGMFMLVRSEAFDSLGGFDERFFMYCEDFDFCARLRLAGWQLHIAKDIVVMHEAQRASNSSVRPFVWHMASFLKLWFAPTVWRYWALVRRSAARR